MGVGVSYMASDDQVAHFGIRNGDQDVTSRKFGCSIPTVA
jgi:hypothetical protein